MPNDKRPVIYDENLNFFRNLILQARLVWLLMGDARVPVWVKGLPIGALVYLIVPFDFDMIPILGYADDVVVLAMGFKMFIDLCPSDVVEEHMRTLTNNKSSTWEVKNQADKNRVSNADSDDLETTVIDGTYSEPPEEK
jgi:uncharacterized membrane protein YkvA (DUF1232 family)